MLKRCVLAAGFVSLFISTGGADTVQLKDKNSVVGTILAEKHDQVIVDIGYTVLTIPRNQIAKISKANSTERGTKAPAFESPQPQPLIAKVPSSATPPTLPTPNPAAAATFYTAPNQSMPQRSVRELVNQIGEAVVQVRTPSGLGSGLIINEDGFLSSLGCHLSENFGKVVSQCRSLIAGNIEIREVIFEDETCHQVPKETLEREKPIDGEVTKNDALNPQTAVIWGN